MLRSISDCLVSLFLPQRCTCGNSVESRADGVSCRDCWTGTKIFSAGDVLCAKCGVFLKESTIQVKTFCRRCDEHSYDEARAIGIYEGALAAAVIRLKSVPSIAQATQFLLREAFERSNFRAIDVLMPVPLSPRRLLERGFNQSIVLVEIVSRFAEIETDLHSLMRTTHTQMHRVAMDRKAREATVKSAFAVARPDLVRGKNILLIDDVLTSGSTVSNCARVLKKNGAGLVNVLTLARAV